MTFGRADFMADHLGFDSLPSRPIKGKDRAQGTLLAGEPVDEQLREKSVEPGLWTNAVAAISCHPRGGTVDCGWRRGCFRRRALSASPEDKKCSSWYSPRARSR